MEKEKQAFLDRRNQIRMAYNKLEARQVEIQERYKAIKNEMKKETDIDATALLESVEGNSSFQSEIDSLDREFKVNRETIEKIKSKGGIDAIFKTDSELETLAAPIIEALNKEGKADNKKLKDLEKRYEKVIAEVIQLEEERQAFLNEMKQKQTLYSIVLSSTNHKGTYQEFVRNYMFTKPEIYAQLGKVKRMSK